jgi:hypothetical protein
LAQNEVPEFVRTLLASGFDVLAVTPKPNYTLVNATRHDEFGLAHKYLFAYAGEQTISGADRNALDKLSRYINAPLVMISEKDTPDEGRVVLSRSQFFGKVGGPVSSVLALEPDYRQRLRELGFNRLPRGLRGQPDDLFETYVHAGLQFLLSGRVLRYGQERRFEAVSDGVAVQRNVPLMLYDCKAAEGRYEFTSTTIRQFADYVNSFHRRYEQYVGRLHAFLAVSSAFQDLDTLRERSGELYSACGIPTVCLTTEDLSDMVSLFATHVALRSVVDWKDIFRAPIVKIGRAKEQVEARLRDQIVGGP